jgi:predicted nucleotidyltransferase
MLEALISSKTRVKLLTLFLLNPESEYYVREIVRMTGENYNAVRRELANLETLGLITGQKKGNQQYYTVNRTFFLYDELQKIVLKTEGIAKIIRDDLAPVSDIECMFIYGSFARGTAGAQSDIDLFIVGNVDENTLIPLVNKSEEAINREINYTLMHSDEFKKRKDSGDPFVKNVIQEKKIVIIGTCDD